MRHRGRAAFVASLLAASGIACSILPFPRAPTECGFPDNTALAYSGHTTLDRLGLSAANPHTDLRAMVYITADPVTFAGSIPAEAEPMPDQRMYCAIYDDGAPLSSAMGGIPDDWSPPD